MFAIAPTDIGWFERMRGGTVGRVVNFWMPTPWGVKGLHPGDRLHFMLKSPIRKIGGYGEFVRYTDMTASDAWSTYGLGNGVDSRDELVAKIERFAEKRSKSFVVTNDPLIGCIELADVVTLDNERFVAPEECGHTFPKEVVKLKYFNEADEIATRLGTTSAGVAAFALVSGTASRKPSLRKDRKGQSIFRNEVLKNYGHRCCVTNESVVELLEAAYIQPFIDDRSNHPQNGLCLRVDIHRLFDEGLIAITEQDTLVTSEKLKGTSYAALNGASIHPPVGARKHPSQEALRFHRAEVFR
jgi:putative restriction endonuclease